MVESIFILIAVVLGYFLRDFRIIKIKNQLAKIKLKKRRTGNAIFMEAEIPEQKEKEELREQEQKILSDFK